MNRAAKAEKQTVTKKQKWHTVVILQRGGVKKERKTHSNHHREREETKNYEDVCRPRKTKE